MVDVYDPVDPKEVKNLQYLINIKTKKNYYDAIAILLGHEVFIKWGCAKLKI